MMNSIAIENEASKKETAQDSASKKSQKAKIRSLSSNLFKLTCLGIFGAAFLAKDEYYWSAEFGIGYAFGIVGATAMALLLVYPLAKRQPFLARRFSLQQWFRLHMVLGIVGPLLILLHTNFRLGSLNSNIAFWSMVLMVSSGLIGRYLYQKIHRGLYGTRIRLSELVGGKRALLENFPTSIDTEHRSQLATQLETLERAMIHPTSIIGNFFRVTFLGVQTGRQRIALNKTLRRIAQHQAKSEPRVAASLEANTSQTDALHTLSSLIDEYILLVRKSAELAFYERLFSLWHLLHLPIFGLLLISTCVHIYAVHNY